MTAAACNSFQQHEADEQHTNQERDMLSTKADSRFFLCCWCHGQCTTKSATQRTTNKTTSAKQRDQTTAWSETKARQWATQNASNKRQNAQECATMSAAKTRPTSAVQVQHQARRECDRNATRVRYKRDKGALQRTQRATQTLTYQHKSAQECATMSSTRSRQLITKRHTKALITTTTRAATNHIKRASPTQHKGIKQLTTSNTFISRQLSTIGI